MFFSTFSFSSTTATTAAAAALLPLQQQISLPFKFAHLSNLLSFPVLHEGEPVDAADVDVLTRFPCGNFTINHHKSQ